MVDIPQGWARRRPILGDQAAVRAFMKRRTADTILLAGCQGRGGHPWPTATYPADFLYDQSV